MLRRAELLLRRPGVRYGAVIGVLWDASPLLTIGVALWTLASAVLPIAVLVAAGRLVGDVPAVTRHGFGSPAGHRAAVALALLAVAYAAALALGPMQTALSSVVKWRVVYRMQDRLIDAVCAPAGIGHLEDARVLDDLALAQGEMVGQRTADAPMTLANVMSNRAGGLLACAALATVRWWLGLGMALMWLAFRRPQLRLIREQGRLYSGASETLRRAWYLHRLASNAAVAKESRVFGLGGWLIERYGAQWRLGISGPWRELIKMDRVVLSLSVGVLAGFLLAAGYLGDAALHRHLGLGTLAVMLPMLAATTPFGDISWDDVALSWQMQGLPRAAALREELTRRRPELSGGRSARGLPETGVRFEQVRYRYPGTDRAVFDGLDLELPAGRSTALVGVNGAGKTTVVKLLARLQDPDAGRILVDQIPLATLDARGWQRQVAVVFQDFVRYPLTLRENIGWGAPEHLHDELGLGACAERAGASLELPWDTVLARAYEDGVDLSGGQWQRVALARALFAVRHGARILVLDEPTAWLDARGEADFFARFLHITEGTTSLIISHRFSTVRRADRICVLQDGRVSEYGDHESLLAADGLYARLFGLQAARYEDER